MKSRWLVRLAVVLAPAALAQGCSLINSYDEVHSAVDSGGAPETGLGSETSPVDEGGSLDAGTDVRVEAGTDAQGGVVVLSALGNKDGGGAPDAGTEYVLAVLDPLTGKELSREAMPVIGAYFDGERELWYIIEAPKAALATFKTSAGPSAAADWTYPTFLHIRTLDTHTGVWTELSKVRIPIPEAAEKVVVLRERIAYIAYAVDGGTGRPMTVVNTTNPAGFGADASTGALTDLPFVPYGVIGTRVGSNTGGVVTLIQDTVCDAGACAFNIQGVKVDGVAAVKNDMAVLSTTTNTSATAAGGSHYNGGVARDVFVMTADGGAAAQLEVHDPLTHVNGQTIPFTATSVRFRPLVVSDCFKTVFVSEQNAGDIYAVPLTVGGASTNIATGHNGALVAFEPYTSSLFAPAGGAFTSIAVTGTAAAPQLSTRTCANPSAACPNPFKLPADLQPYHVATRQPIGTLPFTCPLP